MPYRRTLTNARLGVRMPNVSPSMTLTTVPDNRFSARQGECALTSEQTRKSKRAAMPRRGLRPALGRSSHPLPCSRRRMSRPSRQDGAASSGLMAEGVSRKGSAMNRRRWYREKNGVMNRALCFEYRIDVKDGRISGIARPLHCMPSETSPANAVFCGGRLGCKETPLFSKAVHGGRPFCRETFCGG